MNRYSLSLILIAVGIITTLAAYALFLFGRQIAEDSNFGKSIWWFAHLLQSILIMGCCSLLPFALMTIAIRLSHERRYGSLLITLVLILMISITEFFFLEIVRGGKYNNSNGPNSVFITPGDVYLAFSSILHWFSAIVTLVIAGISRAIEKNQSDL